MISNYFKVSVMLPNGPRETYVFVEGNAIEAFERAKGLQDALASSSGCAVYLSIWKSVPGIDVPEVGKPTENIPMKMQEAS